MRRTNVWLALAAAAAIVSGAMPAMAGETKQQVDLSGVWRFDPSRSDQPPEMRGGPPHGGGHHGGGWGGEHGGGPGGQAGPGGPEGQGQGAGPRRGRLPNLVHIVQKASYVSIEDSTDTELVRILTAGTKADASEGEVRVVEGHWKDGRLEATDEPRPDVRVTQVYALKDNGRTLEVKTKIEGRRSFEMKRVFVREKSGVSG
jgi:hypothetical protein